MLHLIEGCPYSKKVITVASICEYELKIKKWEAKDLLKEKYLKINAFGDTPSLETEQGVISGDIAICNYIINHKNTKNSIKERLLLTNDNYMNSKIFELIKYSDNLSILAFKIFKKHTNKEDITDLEIEFLNKISNFNNILHTNTYLVGNNLTLADLDLFFNIEYVFNNLSNDKKNKIKNIKRWFNNISNNYNYEINFKK